MDTAPAGIAPGAWLKKPGQLPGVSKHRTCLLNFTYGTPGSQNSSAPVKVFVRSLRQVPAREVPWVGLGRRAGPPKYKNLLYIITHGTPGSYNLSAPVKVLVRSLCQVSARGVAWVSLGRLV